MKRISGLFCAAALALTPIHAYAETQTHLLWGDTHLHTSYSLDAYMLGNRTADPDTAYRFAKGLPVVHPGHGARVRIDRPLDFLVVTDHAEFLGVFAEIDKGNEEILTTRMGKQIYDDLKSGRADKLFADIVRMVTEQM